MEKYILQAPNCWHQFNPRVGASKQMRLNGRIEENVSEGLGHGEAELNSAGY